MKKSFLLAAFAALIFLGACTKTESDFSVPAMESISIKSNTINANTGEVITFTVNSSANNADVTSQSKIYVNGSLIAGSSHIFTQEGSFAVYAAKGNLNTNVITIQVTKPSTGTGFKHKVLVEEYSGTWCGNCPRILYGVDLLLQQTNKVVVVGIHLFNGDPFITSQGNTLAANQGIGGVPSGNINRTVSWTGPQYENVNQVVGYIQPSSNTGIAVSSAVSGTTLTATIKVSYQQPITGSAKLTVYLVEDKLFHTQSNYSANLYGGASSISNFEYKGVLRAIVSSVNGDDIAGSGTLIEKPYTLTLPGNINNVANAKIVAFITNAAGAAINVQEAKVGEVKDFERL